MSIAEPYQPEDLIALAAELVERYNGFDSTSVTYEQAQHLMEAIRIACECTSNRRAAYRQEKC